MPDLAALTARDEISSASLVPVEIWRPPADADDVLIVLLIDEEEAEQISQPVEEVRRWSARSGALPQSGDSGLLAYSADGEPWLVDWWRASGNPTIQGYAPPIPESDVLGLVTDLAGKQPLDSDLSAIAALATTSFGRSLLALADAAAARSALGLALDSAVPSYVDWQSWTPIWSGLAIGNGSQTALYAKVGKLVFLRHRLTLGSTSAVTGSVSCDLPLPGNPLGAVPIGQIAFVLGGTRYVGHIEHTATSTILFRAMKADATYLSAVTISGTIPATWASGDRIEASAAYRLA